MKGSSLKSVGPCIIAGTGLGAALLPNALNRPVCSGVLERDKCWLFVVAAAEADVADVDVANVDVVNVRGDGDAEADVDDEASSSGALEVVLVTDCSGCSGICVAVLVLLLLGARLKLDFCFS